MYKKQPRGSNVIEKEGEEKKIKGRKGGRERGIEEYKGRKGKRKGRKKGQREGKNKTQCW